jgi:subtilisin family serine protease
VIGANANNAVGIVGVAPDAKIEVAEACWLDNSTDSSVCDTFSLAKALDAMFPTPPDIINLSLSGPEDALLQRILQRLIDQGVVVAAAAANSIDDNLVFPASMGDVISVASIGHGGSRSDKPPVEIVYAPGDKILVAVPKNDYEFRSGSSLATAHVSGIAALLKAKFPDMQASEIKAALLQSQATGNNGVIAVNACRVFEVAQATMSSCD